LWRSIDQKRNRIKRASRRPWLEVSVDLPKKHGRGGQSALRFARLRLEKRQNYVRKIAELTIQHFITHDRPNVNGLIMAGPARAHPFPPLEHVILHRRAFLHFASATCVVLSLEPLAVLPPPQGCSS